MDESTIAAAGDAVENALRNRFIEPPPDHTTELNSINASLQSIASAMGSVTAEIKDTLKQSVHTEAMRLLQEENAMLHAMVSAQTRRMTQVRQLIKDLASPCIGCKKDAWKPHAAHGLQRMKCWRVFSMPKSTRERLKEQAESYGKQLRAEKAEQKEFLGHLVEETLRLQGEYITLLEEENQQLREQLDGK